MAKLVDLRKKPYKLNEDQIAWVEETIKNMSEEEKVGQLFFNLFSVGKNEFSANDLTNKEIIEKYHLGGARYHGGKKEEIRELLNNLQSYSKIPLLIANNCDSGGNGATLDGTYIASGAQVGATASEEVAFNVGLVSARESRALGVNVGFEPIVDILFNWRNTIVNTRAYSNDPDEVIKYTRAYIKGYKSEGDMIACIKHWPGDGVEERDQHLVLGVNDMEPEEWDRTFGKVYKTLIEEGQADMVMSAHFVMPKYQKKLNPNIEDKDMMPATLSRDLTQVLLKEHLDFNGMVVTDASHMIGMTCMAKREEYVPLTIASGCDMFLFFNNIEEDFNYMLRGYKNGIITEERMTDALRRILGLKARLNLHIKKAEGSLEVSEEGLAIIGQEDHLKMRKQAADLGITLVKDTQNLLPINPKKQKNLAIFYLSNTDPKAIYQSGTDTDKRIKETFEKKGFNVTLIPIDTRIKGSMEEFKAKFDLVLTFLNVRGYAGTNNYRVMYPIAMSVAAPWYIKEVPTIVISLNYTTHLHDYSAAKTYINAYDDNQDILDSLVEKLIGESEFKGVYNDLVWTDKWEAKL